jgi:hypothetical protein
MKSNKKLNAGPGPAKLAKRKDFVQRLNTKDKNTLIKWKDDDKKDATLGYKPQPKMNQGGTTMGIVGGKGRGKYLTSSREMRKESGYSRAKRVKLAAEATGQTEKRVRLTSPTVAGFKLRKAKKDVKEALKTTHKVLSAKITGRGGSKKACKTRQGSENF